MKRRRLFIIITCVFILLCAISITLYLSYQKMLRVINVDVIYDNISVNGIDIGGLTKTSAYDKLKTKLQTPIDLQTIDFQNESDNNKFQFTFKDLNAAYDIQTAVDKSFGYAKDGTVKKRYEAVMNLKRKPLLLYADYKFDKEFIKSKLTELESKVYVKPINATMKRIGGQFKLQDGVVGKKLNVDATLPDVLKLISIKKSGTVKLIYETVLPKYNVSAFDNARSILGTYSTSFAGASANRDANIVNAAAKVNNTVVYPDETFSTNSLLSPFTYNNGYREAPVIVAGKLEDGLGGGICQVSTALYNAALLAELKIVERQNHSLKVGYADYGYDATLAGDYIDFKFKNNSKSPILVEAITNASKLMINIYGRESRDSSKTIKFENVLVETIPPPIENVVTVNDLPHDERKVIVKPKNGYRYNLYKLTFENGKQVNKTLINRSYYKPVRGIVHVGG